MASADHPPAPAPGPATGIQADNPPAPTPGPVTGIQPAPDTLPASVPVPASAAKAPVSPERFARRCRELDVLLVALVLVFSFLVASFAVSNSDFFRHLATGRLLVEGNYPFGGDPFTWGSGDAHWVNHQWLFGLLAYLVYQVPGIGGAAVVVLKALLVTALAGVLLRVGRRRGRPLWVPAACTGLAVLALSPQLFFRPACFSFLFMGLTLWLLRRPRQVREVGQTFLSAETPGRQECLPHGCRSFWLLPPLFLLWVNLDSYFFLGPVLGTLYLAGEAVRLLLVPNQSGPDAPGRGELRTLAIVLVAGLAACLVNPFGIRAFALPEGLGLSEGAEAALQASGASAFFTTPLQGGYLLHANGGLSVAGWAYVPLLLLGLASFVLVALGRDGPRGIIGWRLFLWLPLAILSLSSVRCIAFFAVVAGPVTALNLLDFAPNGAMSLAGRRWALGGRVATLLLALAAVLATVPGWLQAQPHAIRRVAWAVYPDVSLRQVAEQIHTWREQGLVPPGTRWFNLSPEAANYLAWFAPGERGLLDQRYSLFGAVGPDFKLLRQELGKDDPGPAEEAAETGERAPWRRVLRNRGVRFVVVPASDRNLVIAHRLLSNPGEWVPCYLDGRTAVFGWHDPLATVVSALGGTPAGTAVFGWRHPPDGPEPFAALHLDFLRLAFGPKAGTAPPAPGRAPEARSWWSEWWTPPPPADLDGDAVIVHWTRFVAQGPLFHDHYRHEWEALQGASVAGLAAGPGGPLLNWSLASLRLSWTYAVHRIGPGEPTVKPAGVLATDQRAYVLREMHSRQQDSGPPESLYLAVRAARRSLADNPDEPRTHLWLGRTYNSLWWQTRESQLGSDLPQLAEIRRTQTTAALNNALKLGAPPVMAQQAHELLFALYVNIPRQKPYLDLAARHRRAQLESMREAGPLPGVKPAAFQQDLDRLEKQVEDLERRVKDLRDRYEVNAVRKPLREQVKIALEHGLAETAVKVVRAADRADLIDPRRGGGADVVATLLALLLDMGELDDARAVLDPGDQPVDPRTQAANLWFQVRLTAAAGDYAAADRYLAETLKMAAGTVDPRVPPAVAQVVGKALLSEATQAGGALWLPPFLRWQTAIGSTAIPLSLRYLQQMQGQAELHLVRGWLALEAGSIDLAGEQLRLAARLAVPADSRATRLRDLFELTARGNATRALAGRCGAWLDAARR
jgi:hypothetical protein